MSAALAIFLGPSLDARAARALAIDAGLSARAVTVLPPAGRGDVWALLARPPRAIALIDGVFEARPSVWHRELLAALKLGVAVFGGSSMGALRAAELWPFGMVGVGGIYHWLRRGTIVDDGEVALLHAGAEHGFRALTLPLVNVRGAVEGARQAKVLTRAEAAGVVAAAQGMFYQERRWPAVLARLPPATAARLLAWLTKSAPDLKADDARACVSAAAAFARSAPRLARRPLRAAWPPLSALAAEAVLRAADPRA